MYGKVMPEFFIDIGTFANYTRAQSAWNQIKADMEMTI
jgi:NDP-sugar pyrophosphorylase family protein